MSERPLIVVAGPTGSGKSHLALALAEAFHGEIVNCDSLQLYRRLNIGTAKVPFEKRRGIPHHLIDMIDPGEVFTAGDYARVSRPLLGEISARGHVPIVAGGTGFYLRAMLQGLFEGPRRNENLRTRLAARPEKLHRLLQRFDPAAACRIHANDIQKLIRALEVCFETRRPITSLYEYNRRPLEGYSALKLGLDPPRTELHERLNQRCVEMFRSGLIEEVKQIFAMGYPRESKAFEAIGYKEALMLLAGELNEAQALQQMQAHTRQYAKRQLTWFRRDAGIRWVAGFGTLQETIETAKRLVKEFLKKIEQNSRLSRNHS